MTGVRYSADADGCFTVVSMQRQSTWGRYSAGLRSPERTPLAALEGLTGRALF